MNSDNTKTIKRLSSRTSLVLKQLIVLNKKLDQNTKVLEQHTKVLNSHTKLLDNHTSKLDEVQETQEDHTRRLEALAVDVEELKMDVTGIKDAEGMFHSRNKREIDEIKKHLDLPIMPDIPQI